MKRLIFFIVMLLSFAVVNPAYVFDLAIDPIKEIELGLPLAKVEKSLGRELRSVLTEGTDFKAYVVKVEKETAFLNLYWSKGDPDRHIRRVALWFSYEIEFHQNLRRGELMQYAELLTEKEGQHFEIDPEAKAEAWLYPYGQDQIFVSIYIDIDASYKVGIHKSIAE